MLDSPRRLRFDWLLPALFRPRATFAAIAAQTGGVWLAPLLILTLFAVAHAVAAGSVQMSTAVPFEVPSDAPPEFSSVPPEQQSGQIRQAQALAGNPLLVIGVPAVLALAGTWLGWLIVGAVLHLVFTLLGGRGSTRSSLNIVAWASLPYAVRDLVRIVYMLAAQRLIASPGLSGFAPAGGGGLSAFCTGLLGLVDLYLIWQILLIGLGFRTAERVSPAKAWGGVALTILLLMLFQALPGLIFNRLGALTSGGF